AGRTSSPATCSGRRNSSPTASSSSARVRSSPICPWTSCGRSPRRACECRVQGPDLHPLLQHLRAEGSAVEADETGTCASVIGREPREIFGLCVRLGVELTEL